MSVDNLLQRLDRVKKVDTSKWQACCPCHDSKSRSSLSIRELDDGRILLHDHGGCGVDEILGAIGLDISELFPPRISGDYLPRVRKPWHAGDVLAAVAFEILVAWNFAKAMAAGQTLSDTERDRLLLCASRLQKGCEVANG